MIRQFFVWFGGLVTMALIYWAAVILHAIGGYHIELTPIIATAGAAGVIALLCHEFGYSAGRNKAMGDRFYPDADVAYVHFPQGMDSYRARLEFLNRAIKRLHEIESASELAKVNDALDQRPSDQGSQPEGELSRSTGIPADLLAQEADSACLLRSDDAARSAYHAAAVSRGLAQSELRSTSGRNSRDQK
ncbi:hypothetical protein [Pseudomonas aeruginosa]|uniref:hypothetical protein n=1 Tax=Pseudomonas aeruginosa TaxID=287 RepID=UPI000AA40D3A|nr:hypothetical protein [Pseudomonas aeruginosa]